MQRLSILKSLVPWMKKQELKYPWQVSPSPYRVWVSEVMLQQTVVTHVVSYFKNWMEIFPTILHLAQASQVQVLRAFEGLGYYSRARNMHLCARLIEQKYHGEFPTTYAQLRELPGIGDYTARAILSLAYEQDYLLVDANVKRVIRRLFLLEVWSRSFEQNYLSSLPSLSAKDKRYVNEGIMRLGQEICLKAKPLCLLCPLKEACLAYKEGKQDIIKPQRRNISFLSSQLFLIIKGNKVLVEKAEKNRFASLYLFPKLSEEKKLDLEFLSRLGCSLLPGRYTHSYTRFKEDLSVFFLHITNSTALSFVGELFLNVSEWMDVECLENCPLPSVYRKIWQDFFHGSCQLYNESKALGRL